jgi:hypothetical protein
MLDKFMGVEGIRIHNAIARITKTKPSGNRKLRDEGLRRLKIFRLYMDT